MHSCDILAKMRESLRGPEKHESGNTLLTMVQHGFEVRHKIFISYHKFQSIYTLKSSSVNIGAQSRSCLMHEQHTSGAMRCSCQVSSIRYFLDFIQSNGFVDSGETQHIIALANSVLVYSIHGKEMCAYWVLSENQIEGFNPYQ